MRELLKTGVSARELGRPLNLDHRTVKKFKYAEAYPEGSTRLCRELRNQDFGQAPFIVQVDH